MKKVLLIDGDQFLFTACIATEVEVLWDDQNHVLFSNSIKARMVLDGMLDRIFDRFETKEHVLCFTAGTNFRLGIDSTYKEHRVGQRKPLCYAQLRQDVEKDYKCFAVDGLEADDCMGILATKPSEKRQTIIVSQDKDMKTIPTTIWDGKDLVVQSEDAAARFHLYQTLVGDTADGYPGCPGVGPVKAEKLLTVTHSDEALANKQRWGFVVAAYEKAGLTEDDALRQARLARILRHSDWDSEKKAPLLWVPVRAP